MRAHGPAVFTFTVHDNVFLVSVTRAQKETDVSQIW